MPWNKLFTNKSLKPSTKETGDITEQYVADYLIQQGLRLITKNFHSRGGEIDLIMQDHDILVFVEVKYRKNNKFGGAISTLSTAKQQKLTQCASFYLQQSQLNEYNTPCRFDVVALQGNIEKPQLTWLKNAF